MSSFIKNVFGKQERGANAGAGFVDVPGIRYFEIVSRYTNQSKPLEAYVSYDAKEYEHLRTSRVNEFAAQHPTRRKPHDVFFEYPYAPVNPDHVLKEVVLKKSAPKRLPEFTSLNGVYVVSDRIRNEIESMDSNHHAFYPLSVHLYDQSDVLNYNFMQFLERCDCMCLPLSGFVEQRRSDGSVFWMRRDPVAMAYFFEDCVGGRNIFWDVNAKNGAVISGNLAEKLGEFLPRGLYLLEAGVVRRKNGGNL